MTQNKVTFWKKFKNFFKNLIFLKKYVIIFDKSGFLWGFLSTHPPNKTHSTNPKGHTRVQGKNNEYHIKEKMRKMNS
jgi:hypothetical protein